MDKRFNIRVYGIWINKRNVLVNEEIIRGRKIIKFPGGGLNWGEGLTDCLKREWQEELGITVDIVRHFYTTDFFQPSAFDNSQVISVYYLITGQVPDNIVNTEANERTFWMSADNITANTFTLPIDKIVGEMLQKQFYADQQDA